MKRYREDPNAPKHLRALANAARLDELSDASKQKVAERLGLLAVATANVPPPAAPPSRLRLLGSTGGIAVTGIAFIGVAVSLANSHPRSFHPIATMESSPSSPITEAASPGQIALAATSAAAPTSLAIPAMTATHEATATPSTTDSPTVPTLAAVPVAARTSADAEDTTTQKNDSKPVVATIDIAALPNAKSNPKTSPRTSPKISAVSSASPSSSARCTSCESEDVDDLRPELDALDGVRRAYNAGHASDALHLLDAYASKFPNGKLRQEAVVLRIEALYSSGDRASADKLAARLFATSPNTPYAARVRAAGARPSR